MHFVMNYFKSKAIGIEYPCNVKTIFFYINWPISALPFFILAVLTVALTNLISRVTTSRIEDFFKIASLGGDEIWKEDKNTTTPTKTTTTTTDTTTSIFTTTTNNIKIPKLPQLLQ